VFSNGWNGWRLGGGFDIGGFGVLVGGMFDLEYIVHRF